MEWVFIGLMWGTQYGWPEMRKIPSSVMIETKTEEQCIRLGNRFVALSVNDGLKAKYECVHLGK